MTDILTFSESPELAAELISAAATLSAGLGGEGFAVEFDQVRKEVASGEVLLVKSAAAAPRDPELIASALSQASKLRPSSVVMIGSTKLGRMVAGRLSVLNRLNVLCDVRDLKVEGGKLLGTRGAYAGRFKATVHAPLPCVALVPQGAYPRSPASTPKVGEMELAGPSSRVRRTASGDTRASNHDLRSAKVIVAAGRGFRTKEDLAMAERLAGALGGSLGASRPLSSDLGWLGEEYHIGLTGIYVRPNLYVAIGISGQLQHVAGIKDSRIIVAINSDKQAPIFQVADYGIVGDLYQVVPALLKALNA